MIQIAVTVQQLFGTWVWQPDADWLKEQGRTAGCAKLSVDFPGNAAASKSIYFRGDLGIGCFHFRIEL